MIIPSIDLVDGRAVQLSEGGERAFNEEKPEILAEEFAKFGAVAVIDLDAAFGVRHNEDVIGNICAVAECRVGGGIWNVEKADRVMSLGAEKIIIGKMVLKDRQVNHPFLQKLREMLGRERLILAVDIIDGEVVTRGRRQKTGLMWEAIVSELEPYASEFLFTCVEKDSVMRGTTREATKKMKESTDRLITAAGGVFFLDEIAILSKLGVNIQLGKALHTGEIKLPEAFVASLDWEKSFISTAVVDEASHLLMQAYSDRESLLKTFETGMVWFFSRSDGKLFMKGASSGQVQKFLKVRSNRKGDELVITVRQSGQVS